jgi:uncharacterized protein YqcC (DUF446 family)
MAATTRNQVASVILALEAEMRLVGLWQETAPPREALKSTQPFCFDTLEFHQWLQWILIPKTREILEQDLRLPEVSDIAPLAEYRFEQLPQETGRLLELIREFDRLLCGQ